MKIKIDIELKVNNVVKYFVLSDLALMSGWGFISPLFSVFIIEKIAGATIATVGVATALYWVVRSVVQLPIADYLDKTEGERDDFYALIFALILAGISAFSYTLVKSVSGLYFVQFVQALAFGIYVPAWSGIFSRHLDEKRKSFDFSLDSTAIGVASGISGLIGGLLVNYFGFNVVFVLGGILSFTAALLINLVPKIILPEAVSKTSEIHDHKPPLVEQ